MIKYTEYTFYNKLQSIISNPMYILYSVNIFALMFCTGTKCII